MKKFFLALGVAAVALGFSSCDKEAGSTSGTPAKSNDSLAILMGQIQGARYQGMWSSMPDSVKKKFDRDKFIAGMKSVLDLNLKDDEAYVAGMNMAMQFAQNIIQMEESGISFNKKEFVENFSSVFMKDSVNLAEMEAKNMAMRVYMNQAQEAMMKHQQEEQQRAMAAAQAKAEPNIKAGKEFVEKQKKADPSIKTTESGVSYKVINEGSGAKPSKNDVVKVNYTGKHIDGTEFDSSKGTPRQFNVGGVVPGFGEILQMMSPGAKYVAYIPSDKGYGNTGAGNIEPGETLVFEIELVEVGSNASKAAK